MGIDLRSCSLLLFVTLIIIIGETVLVDYHFQMVRHVLMYFLLVITGLLGSSCSFDMDTGPPNNPGGTIYYDTETSIFNGHVFSDDRNIPVDSARVTVIMYHYTSQLTSSEYARYEYGDTDTTGRFSLTYLSNGYLCETHCAAPGYWYYKLDFSPECNQKDFHVPFKERMPDTIFMHPL